MSTPTDSTNSASARAARYARSRHRSASHASAHDVDGGEEQTVPQLALVPQEPGVLVDTPEKLAELIEDVRAEGMLAYDSEFIGELTYHPKLCLLQVATSQRVAMIDPLVGLNLDTFWALLTDESILKIVHAGQQDIEPVHRLTGKPARNIFDTQLAAGFVSLAYPSSLSKLVLELVGVKLQKGLTFTHWDQRPLSSSQLRYAADDVRYLPAIHAELSKRLDANGCRSFAEEEFAALCDPDQYTFDAETDWLRIRGAGTLGPAQAAVLKSLYLWRDGAARDADVPPRAMLRDEILLDMARTPIKSIEKLERVKGLPRPVEQEHGAAIVEVTAAALQSPLESSRGGRPIEPLPSEKFRADAIWALVQTVSISRGIDPALAASRADVGEFATAIFGDGDFTGLRLMRGWRGEAVGHPVVKLVNDSPALSVEWRDGNLKTR